MVKHAAVIGLLFSMSLMVCIPLGGCSHDRHGSGYGASRVTSVSRVIIPLNGGLTIQPPQKMTDVSTLWAPLTSREKNIVVQSGRPPAQLRKGHGTANRWLPVTEHLSMQEYYYRLHVSNTNVMDRTLSRAQRYLPEILRAVEAKGLPKALAYLPMVESAYEPQAISQAGAAGLWQLMPATARRFGLTVSKTADERLDPVKSTRAATDYLCYLYEYFNDWPLAITAYNCGEGAMKKALNTVKGTTLADVSKSSRQQPGLPGVLTSESLNFLPRLVAAANFFEEQAPGVQRHPTTTRYTPAYQAPVQTPPLRHEQYAAATRSAVSPQNSGAQKAVNPVIITSQTDTATPALLVSQAKQVRMVNLTRSRNPASPVLLSSSPVRPFSGNNAVTAAQASVRPACPPGQAAFVAGMNRITP